MWSHLFKFQWHTEKLQQESRLLGPGFGLISPHASKISVIKTMRIPKLQENRGRIVGNNILSRYWTRISENIPISTRHCITLTGSSNY